MSKADSKWITEEAAKHNISVMPMTNLVGYAESFLSQEKFIHLRGVNNNYFNLKADGFETFAKSVIDQLLDCFKPEILHIGGDEVSLSEEGRRDYVEFLSSMKNKGVKTAIWGDMLIKRMEIGEMMPKDFIFHDW